MLRGELNDPEGAVFDLIELLQRPTQNSRECDRSRPSALAGSSPSGSPVPVTPRPALPSCAICRRTLPDSWRMGIPNLPRLRQPSLNSAESSAGRVAESACYSRGLWRPPAGLGATVS